MVSSRQFQLAKRAATPRDGAFDRAYDFNDMLKASNGRHERSRFNDLSARKKNDQPSRQDLIRLDVKYAF